MVDPFAIDRKVPREVLVLQPVADLGEPDAAGQGGGEYLERGPFMGGAHEVVHVPFPRLEGGPAVRRVLVAADLREPLFLDIAFVVIGDQLEEGAEMPQVAGAQLGEAHEIDAGEIGEIRQVLDQEEAEPLDAEIAVVDADQPGMADIGGPALPRMRLEPFHQPAHRGLAPRPEPDAPRRTS